MIECLADLLELQALTTRGSEDEREFFELYHATCELKATLSNDSILD